MRHFQVFHLQHSSCSFYAFNQIGSNFAVIWAAAGFSWKKKLYNKTGHHYEVAQEKEAILGVATRGQTIECLQQKMNRHLRIKITGCSDIFEMWTINSQTHTKVCHFMEWTQSFILQNDVYNKHPPRRSPSCYSQSHDCAQSSLASYLSGCGSVSQNGRHSSVSFPAATQSLPPRAANTWLDLQFW